eukprot:scaffold3898_cov102-Skeletonema_dohrnii-CCMP3373.AAC.1
MPAEPNQLTFVALCPPDASALRILSLRISSSLTNGSLHHCFTAYSTYRDHSLGKSAAMSSLHIIIIPCSNIIPVEPESTN